MLRKWYRNVVECHQMSSKMWWNVRLKMWSNVTENVGECHRMSSNVKKCRKMWLKCEKKVCWHSHLTGELSLPHKASPVAVYFLPDSALSHSLLGISPLIRPQGVAIFTSTSVTVFDTPTSTTPFLSGTKSPHSYLWFFTAPRPFIPSSPPTALFSVNSLPLARFVAYHHRSFGSPPSPPSFVPYPVDTSTGSPNSP